MKFYNIALFVNLNAVLIGTNIILQKCSRVLYSQVYFSVHLCYSVQDLSDFIKNTEHGLGKSVKDGDYAGLVEIMGHLMGIRDRQQNTEQQFKPLKSTSDLLKTYSQQLPEHVYTLLEVCVDKQTDMLSYLVLISVQADFLTHGVFRNCLINGRI